MDRGGKIGGRNGAWGGSPGIRMSLLQGGGLGAAWGFFHGCLVQSVVSLGDPEYAPSRAALLVGFHLLAGVLSGALLGLGIAGLRERRGRAGADPRGFPDLVTALLAAGFCLQVINLMAVKTLHRGGLGSKETTALLLFGSLAVFAALRFRRRLAGRIGRPLPFFLLASCGISTLLVGGLFLNDFYLPRLLSLRSLLGNLLFLLGVVLFFAPAIRGCIGRSEPLPGWKAAGKGAVATIATLGFLLVFTATLTASPSLLDPGLPRPPSARGGASSEPEPPPILLIVIDTLRADHLSLYGYPRVTSPNLDRFAQDAVLYRNATSPSSWTLPAHASMFTGMYPSSHGAHFAEEEVLEIPAGEVSRIETTSPAWPLPDSATTLAEYLQGAGYRTGAVVANYSFLFRSFGCAQGFEMYDDRVRRTEFFDSFLFFRLLHRFEGDYHAYQVSRKYRSAREIRRGARRFLDEAGGGPFFLFLNYMEPHAPYHPPGDFREMFPGRLPSYRGAEGEILSGDRDLLPEEREHLISQYDGEIAAVDAELGRLFRDLKRRGLYDRSLVIVTSDHGEFFGEHRLMFHGCGLYEEVLRVPLIIKYPGSHPRGIRETPVSTVDILPTILSRIGQELPEGLDGRPLGGPSRPVVSEQFVPRQLAMHYGGRFSRSERSVRSGTFKLIARSDGTRELYNLVLDPSESRNLAGRFPVLVEILAKELRTPGGSEQRDRGPLPDPDPEALRRLRSLGYL